MTLADVSTLTLDSTSQVITGVAAGDTLDNVNNTITGYGELGAGQLTLINEAKGTIEATVGALVINTGSVALLNHGLLEAVGGTLVVQSVLNETPRAARSPRWTPARSPVSCCWMAARSAAARSRPTSPIRRPG